MQSSRSRLLYIALPQEEISDFLVVINELAGALLIGALMISIGWLSWELICALGRLYLVPDDVLRARAKRILNKQQKTFAATTLEDVIVGEFELRYQRLTFVRVLGPALGFMLTVSSLIAGLHPSVATQNSFLFVSSLQLALVATFVGLLARIVAEFALRVHTSASERALQLIKVP